MKVTTKVALLTFAQLVVVFALAAYKWSSSTPDS